MLGLHVIWAEWCGLGKKIWAGKNIWAEFCGSKKMVWAGLNYVGQKIVWAEKNIWSELGLHNMWALAGQILFFDVPCHVSAT